MSTAPSKEEIATPEKSDPDARDEIVFVELPAPQGWKKKV